jgi:hypothetical protein
LGAHTVNKLTCFAPIFKPALALEVLYAKRSVGRQFRFRKIQVFRQGHKTIKPLQAVFSIAVLCRAGNNSGLRNGRSKPHGNQNPRRYRLYTNMIDKTRINGRAGSGKARVYIKSMSFVLFFAPNQSKTAYRRNTMYAIFKRIKTGRVV